jgi:hypothetical protein
MKFNRLRIFVSALSVVVCVILIALWVRSQYVWDAITFQITPTHKYHVASCNGILAVCQIPNTNLQGKPWVDPFGNDLFPLNPEYLVPIWWNQLHVHRYSHPVDNDKLKVFTIGWPTPAEPYMFSAISSSYWLLVLTSTICAIAPWATRIRWHFSLRSLLIATAIIAAGLGLSIYLMGR